MVENQSRGKERGVRLETEGESVFYRSLIVRLNQLYGWLGNKTETAIVLALRKNGSLGFTQLQDEIERCWQKVSRSPSSVQLALKNLQFSRHVAHNEDGTYRLDEIGYTTADLQITISRIAARDEALVPEVREVHRQICEYTGGVAIETMKSLSLINSVDFKAKGKGLGATL